MNDAILNTMELEGGYVNDSDDLGGETYKGITRKNYPHWLGWRLIDKSKGKRDLGSIDALQSMVYNFYYENYYKDFAKYDKEIADKLFDMSVNLGKSRTKKIFQKALNVLNRNEKDFDDLVVDGLLGSKTLNAYNKVNKKNLLKTLEGLQFMHYYQLAESGIKTQEKFFNGWLKRV